MILELKNINKTYVQGKLETPVLKDVNFSMEEGEYVAIMGPSGSGKSTLMNIIGCLDVATSGQIFIDGEDISKLNDNQMADVRLKKLGFIFQSFQLLPYESAQENVALPLSYAGVPVKVRRERAAEALKQVGLGDRIKYAPIQLSGGQKQRVAIARAMINNPKILLADEPTGALDQASGRAVMDIFDKLNAEGVSILMITHDANIAARAKRIVRIEDGILFDPDRDKEKEEAAAAAEADTDAAAEPTAEAPAEAVPEAAAGPAAEESAAETAVPAADKAGEVQE